MDQALEPELGQHFPCVCRMVDVFGMQPVKNFCVGTALPEGIHQSPNSFQGT